MDEKGFEESIVGCEKKSGFSCVYTGTRQVVFLLGGTKSSDIACDKK